MTTKGGGGHVTWEKVGGRGVGDAEGSLTGALPAIPGVGIGGMMPGRLIGDDP